MPLLSATNLSIGFPGIAPIATALSFSVNSGELLLISGPNGSGKSTLLKVILGELTKLSGEFNNEIPRAKTAVIPQLQNMAFHLPLTLDDVIQISQCKKVPEEKIEGVGLLDRSQLHLLWNTASGGERQRTLMTRALLREPRLLVLDEPFNHLDESSHHRILESISHFLKGGSDRGAVLVSHVGITELKALSLKVSHLKLGGGT